MVFWLGLLMGAIASTLAVGAWRRFRIRSAATSTTSAGAVVWAWGNNDSGQLGSADRLPGATPAPVKGADGTGYLADVVAIAAGYGHSVALKRDGTVWAWGRNGEGQLGDGSTQDRLLPVQVRGPGGTGQLTGVAAVAVGDTHSLAIDAQGRVWAWGYNVNGQLGDGSTTNRTEPTAVRGPGGQGQLDNAVAAAGGSAHSVVLKSDGSLFAWGLNVSGQAGDGTRVNLPYPAPVHAPSPGGGNLTGVRAIAAGNSHTVASHRGSSPPAWAWGLNEHGALGDGTRSVRNLPVAVNGIGNSGATIVCAGTRHTLVLAGDRSVWSFGRNGEGQLGDGTTTTSLIPVRVVGPSAELPLAPVVGLSSTRDQVLALAEDGSVWAWGNVIGGVGDGGLLGHHPRPIRVLGHGGVGHLSGASAVASGGTFNLALAPPPAVARPDLAMRQWRRFDPGAPEPARDWLGPWIGAASIDGTGATQSLRTASDVTASGRVIVRLHNAGQSAGRFTLTGGGGNAHWIVAYRDSEAGRATIDPAELGAALPWDSLPDITGAVTGSGWTSPSIPADESRDLLLEVQARLNGAGSGGYPDLALTLSARSANDPDVRDALRVVVYWQWVG